MLKNRLIPCIIINNGLIVQSFGFEKYLPIGRLAAAIEFFVNWDVDEIIIIDISGAGDMKAFQHETIQNALFKCFIPVTLGGGIRTFSDVEIAMAAGADKVTLNTALYKDPQFVRKASDKYGSSCITASIDVKKEKDSYTVYVEGGTLSTETKLEDYITYCEALGVGEIFLNSIDRDGSRLGYDLDLLKLANSVSSVPVIACGGVGNFKHLVDGITVGGCQAVSAANIFQHTEHSTIAAKSVMKKAGVNIRLNSEVKYSDFSFDNIGRII